MEPHESGTLVIQVATHEQRLNEVEARIGEDRAETRRRSEKTDHKLDELSASIEEIRRDLHASKVLGRAALGAVMALGAVVGYLIDAVSRFFQRG